MKKSILILAIAAFAFASCTKTGVSPSAASPASSSLLAKDGKNHDINDDNLPKYSGKDDGAKHDANDDNLPKHSGKDDGVKPK